MDRESPSVSHRRSRSRRRSAAAGPDAAVPRRPSDLTESLCLALSATHDPSEAARAFLRDVAAALGVEAWLAAWDADRGEATWLPAGSSGPFPSELAGRRDSLLARALVDGVSSRVDDLEAGGGFAERRHMRSRGGAWSVQAIGSAGTREGCLVLRAPAATELGAGVLERLGPALSLAELHLRLARVQRDLESRVEQRTAEIALLYETSRALGFVAEPEDLFRLLASALRRAVPFDLCAFLLALPERREMVVHLAAASDPRTVRKLARLASDEFRRLSGTSPGRAPVTIQTLDTAAGGPGLTAADLRAVAHAPLQVRGRTVGVLSVASRQAEAFGEVRMRLLHTIAAQAALTLDRLRSAREAESRRVHSMIESMAEGVVLLDRSLRPVMVNPAARAGLEVLTGRRAPKTVTHLGGVSLRSLLRDLDSSEAPVRTFEVGSADRGRIFSITCSPVRGPEGRAEGLVVGVSDVTESRVLQIQLAQRERLSALGEMISGVAHELNNPLASVMAHAELLLARPAEPVVHRKLESIVSESRRCQRIVQSLLRFARPHAPERLPVDLNEAVESVLQLLGRQLQVDDITVALDLTRPLPPVMGDPHLLQQVVLNVVFNAYQAMKERGGPGSLAVATGSRGASVVVTFTDDGPGIASEHLNRIFDPFFTTKEVGKGTGLGLSLAYTAVRDHGGTIMASSGLGRGATFIVELPAAGAAEVAAARRADVAPGRALRTDTPGAPSATEPCGARIRGAEDETALAEVMTEVLQAHGYTVETVGDGRAARERVASGEYDVIISDLRMPQMNGREFYRHVAGTRPSLARRVIFSTGDTANPEAQAFFEEAGVPVLSKPFSLAELLSMVESVLARD